MALVWRLRDKLLGVESFVTLMVVFVFAFSSNLGECPVLHAELWAMLYEIHFAWASCFRNLYIESDSQLAIDLLKNGCSTRH